MDAKDFKKDFLDDIKTFSMINGEGTCACFVSSVATYLIDNDIIPDYTQCYYTGKYKSKIYRIDGYFYDEFDDIMNLIVADYDGIEERVLTKTDAVTYVSRAIVFVDAALNSTLCEEVDISNPASDLIDLLKKCRNKIRKFRVFIFTNADMSKRIKNVECSNYCEIPVEAQIWDLNRLFDVVSVPENENIKINFKDFGVNGIPCIKANVGDNQKYNSYLGVIPGNLLAQIYDKYGARLLEGNVRSFLSTKVAVNKKIRETIINKPQMFFAFNNGISVTAEKIEIESREGVCFVVSAENFQIINGGQTTASLYTTQRNNKADLSKIYVQMKLTEIDRDKVTNDEADQLIRDISRSSNSQNKVSDADFFASHPFHRQIETISKITRAPALHGAQYETIWFYERARGQYLQEQLRLTPTKKKAFLLRTPKNQVISKTDLAKLQNSWLGHPDVVSKGAQTNFMQFANYIDDKWHEDDLQFNEYYYRKTVGLKIMYSYLFSYIPKQSWYCGGYRANVISYTIALFHFLIKEQFKNRSLDFNLIWNRQELPDEVKNTLGIIAEKIFYKITDDNRQIINVTQWCKKTACWDSVKNIPLHLSDELKECLCSSEDSNHEKKIARKDQKLVKGIKAQEEVVKYPAQYWKRLAQFATLHKLLTPLYISALNIAEQLPNKIPNSVQSRRLLDLENQAKAEGFQYNIESE